MNWRVSVEVEATEDAAAKLRSLLPELLEGAGYVTTTGSTIIASWLVRETEKLHRAALEDLVRRNGDQGRKGGNTSRL